MTTQIGRVEEGCVRKSKHCRCSKVSI